MKELIFNNFPFDDCECNHYIFSTFTAVEAITMYNPGYSRIDSYVYGLEEICNDKEKLELTDKLYSVI